MIIGALCSLRPQPVPPAACVLRLVGSRTRSGRAFLGARRTGTRCCFRRAAAGTAGVPRSCVRGRPRAARRSLRITRRQRRDSLIDQPLDALLSPLLAFDEVPTTEAPVTDHRPLRATLANLVRRDGCGVSSARDTRLQRIVALKFLPSTLSSDGRAKSRFLLEARAAAALDHRNVCAIHEIGETADGQLFISMPFYDGETLTDRLSRGSLAASETVSIASQVAHGLAHAHDRGIVHRDIKPGNLMLTADGVVKILDFGIVEVERRGPDANRRGSGHAAVHDPDTSLRSDRYPSRSVVARGCDVQNAGSPTAVRGGRRTPVARGHRLRAAAVAAGRPPGRSRELSRLIHQLLARTPDDRPANINVVIEAIGCPGPTSRARANP